MEVWLDGWEVNSAHPQLLKEQEPGLVSLACSLILLFWMNISYTFLDSFVGG